MTRADRYDVAIVGGGFSGAVLAARLVTEKTGPPVRVLLLDRLGRFGRGVAYGTPNPRHLLNVSAGGMSAFDDVPDDFVNWARMRVAGVDRGTYLPRTLYGDYVAAVLDHAIRRHSARSTIEERVAAVARVEAPRPGEAGLRLRLEDGTVAARRVVLATGNAAARPMTVPGLDAPEVRERYVADPWAPAALDRVPSAADIVVVGTGLTMIDVALEIMGRGHRGRVLAISRRGLMPQPHVTAVPPSAAWIPRDVIDGTPGVNRLVRAVRDAAARAAGEGVDWRAVIAELRPVTPAVWQRLGAAGQARFLRHVAPFWETHRHRVASAVHDVVLGLMASGQLEARAGRLASVEGRRTHVLVRVVPRGGGAELRVEASAIINCTGPDPDVRTSQDPLFQSLLASGAIRSGPHGLGIDVAPTGAVIDAAGAASDVLFAIGPLRRGCLFETTAVPELRVQARVLAAHIRNARPSG